MGVSLGVRSKQARGTAPHQKKKNDDDDDDNDDHDDDDHDHAKTTGHEGGFEATNLGCITPPP